MPYNPFNADRLYTYDELVEMMAEDYGCDLEEAEYWVDLAIEDGVITGHRIH